MATQKQIRDTRMMNAASRFVKAVGDRLDRANGVPKKKRKPRLKPKRKP